jgi:hypothetical protein
VHRQPRLLVRRRRVGPALLDLAQAAAQPGLVAETRARQIEVVEVQVDVAGFTPAPELAIDVGQRAQPVVVLVVDDVGLAQQLAVGALGVLDPAVGHRLLGGDRGGLDALEGSTGHG